MRQSSMRIGVDHVVAQIALLQRRIERCRLRQAKQKIRHRRAGRLVLRGVFCKQAGEGEVARRIGAGQKVAMHAPIVAAETQVVFAVNPAQHLGGRDRLRDREARLRLTEPVELVQIDARQAEVQWNVVGHRDAGGVRNIVGGVGKKVGRVAAAAVPAHV